MGNCCRKRQKRNVVLLLVGLDNAGKTVAVKGLAGENLENSIPTVGFSTINLKYLDVNVTIYDLGGGRDIRGIWHRYFVDVHGVIFVIDASDHLRLNEAKHVFREVLSHEKISGKPVLLLANKQDYQNALDEIDIAEKLQLEELVNEQKCPTLIESCSATEGSKNSKIDPGIKNGYRWLLNSILRDYKMLNERVLSDVEEQKLIERDIRQKQILKLAVREQNANSPEHNHVEFTKDPFKPINELISEKNNAVSLKPEDIFMAKNHSNGALSIRSSSPIVLKNMNYNINQRPKSAIDVVKKQLEKTSRRNSLFSTCSNKTTPVTLFTPKNASPVHSISSSLPMENGNINTKTLTVTDLPNTVEDLSIENHMNDLFTLNRFKHNSSPQNFMSSVFKETNGVSLNAKQLKRANAIQHDFDLIVKDVS